MQKAHNGNILVIGCGLGDDAMALDIGGYEVDWFKTHELYTQESRISNTKFRILYTKEDR